MLHDTKLRARFRDLRNRHFRRRDDWQRAVTRQDLNEAERHKTSAHRLLRKSFDVEAKAYARAEWWAGGSYED